MKEKTLKYLPVLPHNKKIIANIYKDNKISEHIDELYALIDYQMNIIAEQRSVIIADKHREAWKQYYRALDEYHSQSRKYFTQTELESRKC